MQMTTQAGTKRRTRRCPELLETFQSICLEANVTVPQPFTERYSILRLSFVGGIIILQLICRFAALLQYHSIEILRSSTFIHDTDLEALRR